MVRDASGQIQTTGHAWDEDLGEYNNPLPRWWMWLFSSPSCSAWATCAFYPGLGAYAGSLGWSSRGQYEDEVKAADAQYGPLFAKFAGLDLKAVAADPQARAIGERLFLTYCSQCHGSDARGSKGFPNLTDRDWLYGGAPETIETTILHGRNGVMPPMAAALGGDEGVKNVANYVLSLSGSANDSVAAALGKPKFAVCAACHGPDGKGNPALGAPNLTDKIWLFGGGLENVTETINKGRNSVMPAHQDLLGPDKVHLLAAYVWSLSNDTTAVAAAGTLAPAAAARCRCTQGRCRSGRPRPRCRACRHHPCRRARRGAQVKPEK